MTDEIKKPEKIEKLKVDPTDPYSYGVFRGYNNACDDWESWHNAKLTRILNEINRYLSKNGERIIVIDRTLVDVNKVLRGLIDKELEEIK